MSKETKESYSMTMMVLYLLRDDPRYATISRLANILDEKNFMKFIAYFGGTEIKVPSTKEVTDVLDGLLYYKIVSEGVGTSEYNRSQMDNLQTVSRDIVEEAKRIELAINALSNRYGV